MTIQDRAIGRCLAGRTMDAAWLARQSKGHTGREGGLQGYQKNGRTRGRVRSVVDVGKRGKEGAGARHSVKKILLPENTDVFRHTANGQIEYLNPTC